ncbi:response regulator transcription factor [Arthrobacter agilis]|jgi:DNA-binding response OmpR family regulator|uniref:response regulator transcription factor n=1 Tax=Arthrobacter agilis TaxID=37921 RepID=UPI002782051E|nr:response regulator transcription factor [Arthrobacter agilis]MDQ0736126.1 DNA-binding response OmpR family regulator [Arthrobacter agilis]
MSSSGPGDVRAAVVIEDDLDIRNLVSAILAQGGFQVTDAATGREGVDVVRQEHPTVVTLDIGLPDIDGYEVLRRIRSTTDCYVIVISGRDDELDILTALQAGADDYVLKPFRPRELRARIDAMLRRPRAGLVAQQPPARSAAPAAAGIPVEDERLESSDTLLRNGVLVVDGEARTASCAGVELPLTKTEFNLLHELMRSNGAVRTKEELVRISRGRDYRGYNFVSRTDERAIEVHIANLRQKLARTKGDPDLIVTVRGVGFRIVPRSATSR